MVQINSKLKSKAIGAALLAVTGCVPAQAQVTVSAQDSDRPEWYVGIGAGLNFSNLQFSDIDEALYPENKSNMSGVFSFFAEYDFGRSRCFAVRPQLSFLTRGGKLTMAPAVPRGTLVMIQLN